MHRRRAQESIHRRQFLADAACVSALLTCAASGCTLPVRSFRARPGAVIDVPVERYPELERPGGIVKVLIQDSRAIFVRHEGDGRYTGISAVCTHQGCLVEPSGDGFRCPCHGSVYDHDGVNIGGPAPRPLLKLRAERTGAAVRLFLDARST